MISYIHNSHSFIEQHLYSDACLYLPVAKVCEKGLCVPWDLELLLYLILGELAIFRLLY